MCCLLLYAFDACVNYLCLVTLYCLFVDYCVSSLVYMVFYSCVLLLCVYAWLRRLSLIQVVADVVQMLEIHL